MTAASAQLRWTPAAAADFVVAALTQLRAPMAAAQRCAEVLVDASLRGIDSHGIALTAVHAERIRSGQIHPDRAAVVRRDGPSTAWVDGQHGLGPVLATQAVDLAADKARRSGLGAVSLYDGNYVGALSTYVEAPARDGLVALAAANATPRVAPHGGRTGLHGTNPIAWSAPVARGEPVVFDAATGHAAARLVQAADEGRDIPAGIALDETGAPTTDPALAARGTLLPVGGALGYGLGLLVDVLTGGLAGAPCGPEVPPVTAVEGAYGCSFFVLVVDPDAFGGSQALAAALARLTAAARNVSPVPGVDAVRVPGDRARQTRARRQRDGIPISPRRWEALRQRLEACGITPAPAPEPLAPA